MPFRNQDLRCGSTVPVSALVFRTQRAWSDKSPAQSAQPDAQVWKGGVPPGWAKTDLILLSMAARTD